MSVMASSRPFEPGTTGWTAQDLEDAQIAEKWFQGAYEIIDGVLTTMAPAYFHGMRPLEELVFLLKAHQKECGLPNSFAHEIDIIIDDDRVVRADTVWMTPEDQQRQREAMAVVGKSDPERTRVLTAPSLIIESISPGHERHDEKTKRRWYAEFGVPNYWILNSFTRSLKCLVRDAGDYRVDAEGRESDELRPTLFPGLTISLTQLWHE